MDLIRPLVEAKLVKRVGTLKNGRYVLAMRARAYSEGQAAHSSQVRQHTARAG